MGDEDLEDVRPLGLRGLRRQAPAVVKVGQCTFSVAVSAATDTVYAPSAGSVASNCNGGDTVSVINGQTNRVVATIPGIPSPGGVTVNQETNKVYVTNIFENTVTLLTS